MSRLLPAFLYSAGTHTSELACNVFWEVLGELGGERGGGQGWQGTVREGGGGGGGGAAGTSLLMVT